VLQRPAAEGLVLLLPLGLGAVDGGGRQGGRLALELPQGGLAVTAGKPFQVQPGEEALGYRPGPDAHLAGRATR
jgi:hypothetical protein